MSTDSPRRPPIPNFGAIPFTRLLGVEREFTRDGVARLVVDEREDLSNPIGAMHGGVVATLLDVVMASAVVSKVEFTFTAVTLTLNCSFLRPGRGRLTADGRVHDITEQVASCSAEVRDAEGEVVARAQGSFRLLPVAVNRLEAGRS